MNTIISSTRETTRLQTSFIRRSLALLFFLATFCLGGLTAKAYVVNVSGGTLSGNSFTFHVDGLPGVVWTVSATSDWITWTDIGTIILGGGGPGPSNSVPEQLSFQGANFTDYSISGVSKRFYYIHGTINGGYAHSVDSVGFVRVSAGPALTQISNPLNAPNNSLTGLFAQSSLPSGTEVIKWNGSGVDTFTWNGSTWSPNGTVTIVPGEGAFIRNNTSSTITVNFVGLVRQGTLVKSLASGWNLVGMPAPVVGGISAFNFQPNEGDMVVPFDPAVQTYPHYSMYIDGVWSEMMTGDPYEPVIQVGQGFYLWNESASARNWTYTFFVNYPH